VAAVEQSVHVLPPVPHWELLVLPATQVPEAQQPPLQVALALHVLLQVWVKRSQAWSAGQSLEVEQPQLPLMQWLLPVHAPHIAPLFPQTASVVSTMQVPAALQHPVAQLAGVHLSVH
jgi:hypothetical protein